ncbi:hypothetical protein B0H14DRAFT_3770234 [Mycena olivaceomarginata]|nr:hypothetical protein B0H14DRAFT_3770234 [Mycena olivaceomarginata]
MAPTESAVGGPGRLRPVRLFDGLTARRDGTGPAISAYQNQLYEQFFPQGYAMLAQSMAELESRKIASAEFSGSVLSTTEIHLPRSMSPRKCWDVRFDTIEVLTVLGRYNDKRRGHLISWDDGSSIYDLPPPEKGGYSDSSCEREATESDDAAARLADWEARRGRRMLNTRKIFRRIVECIFCVVARKGNDGDNNSLFLHSSSLSLFVSPCSLPTVHTRRDSTRVIQALSLNIWFTAVPLLSRVPCLLQSKLMAFPCPTRWPAFNTPAEDSHHAALAKRVYNLQFTFDLNTDPETETDYYVSEDSDLDGDSEGSDSGVEDSEPLAPDLPQENCAAELDIEIPGIERDEVDFENPPTVEEFWALFAIAMPRLLNLFTFSLSYDHYDENFLRRLIHLGNLAQSFPTSLLTMHLKPLPCHYSISRLDLDLEYAWDKPSWRSNISQIPYIRQLILSTPAYVVWPPSAKTFSRTRDEWTEQLGNRSSSKLRDIVINCSFLDGGLRVMYWAGNTRMPAEALRLTREIAGGQGFQWVWRLKDNEWKRVKITRPADSDRAAYCFGPEMSNCYWTWMLDTELEDWVDNWFDRQTGNPPPYDGFAITY